MSLEIVDELMTPGCPQCAIKHLSAALCYAAELGRLPGRDDCCGSQVLAARAYINLGEVMIGYRSHLWYAVGLLQRAEEKSLSEGCEIPGARQARLLLEERGEAAVQEAMLTVAKVYLGPSAMYLAHLDEAVRELPGHDWRGFVDIPALIEDIRREYFDLPEAAVAEGETTTNQGEPEMATNKAAVVKKTSKTKVPAAPAAKATHAACKGGKCKGKSCKK